MEQYCLVSNCLIGKVMNRDEVGKSEKMFRYELSLDYIQIPGFCLQENSHFRSGCLLHSDFKDLPTRTAPLPRLLQQF